MDDWIKLGKEFGLPVLQLAVIYYFIDKRVWPAFDKFLDRMAKVSEKNSEQSLSLNTSWLTALSEFKESIIHLGAKLDDSVSRLANKFDLVVRSIDDKIAQELARGPFTKENHPKRREGDKM